MITQKTTWLDWEDNLVMMTAQLNQNLKPTNMQKRLIKNRNKSNKHDYTEKNLVRLRRHFVSFMGKTT
jgi:hypothetical protein